MVRWKGKGERLVCISANSGICNFVTFQFEMFIIKLINLFQIFCFIFKHYDFTLYAVLWDLYWFG